MSSDSEEVWNSLWRALGCCVPAPVWSQSDLGNSIGNPSSNPGGWRDTQYLGRHTEVGGVLLESSQTGREGAGLPLGGGQDCL